jgi:hypothetical protein
LTKIQQLLREQIAGLTSDPEQLKLLPHNMTIYHRLLDPEAYRDKTVPSADSLYEEAQALMFGGGDTVGNTLMLGTYHLLRQPETLAKLKKEILDAWPTLSSEPKLRDLEVLPYLNAVIKESLRLSSGVTSGLLRVVPPTGATIAGVAVPPGVRLQSLHEFRIRLTPPDHRSNRQHLCALQRLALPVPTVLHPRALAREQGAGQLACCLFQGAEDVPGD